MAADVGDQVTAPATHGHIQWEAFKAPGMQCWGIRDDLGFTLLTHDRDGWSAKRVAELLNLGTAALEGRLARAKEPA